MNDLTYKVTSHSNHYDEMMKEIMTSEDFKDVTLISEDNQEFRTHKSILSATSPFFKDLFLAENTRAKTVYLTGIYQAQIELILQYIYLGETKVYEKDLEEFIDAAESLGMSLDDCSGKNFCEPKIVHHTNEPGATKVDRISSDINMQNIIGMPIALDSGHDVQNIKPVKKIKKEVNHVCGRCSKKFEDKKQILIHIESDHGGMRYSCEFCPKQIPYMSKNKQNVINHNQRYHSKEKFSCTLCDFQSISGHKLHNHMTQHYRCKSALIYCGQCDKIYFDMDKLTEHVKTSHSFYCEECNIGFKNEDILKHHLASRVEHNRVSCRYCDKKLIGKEGLLQHIIKAHDDKIINKSK